ncbi:MAG: peptide-methionine (S)-S-oxide reductase MsrA [Terriglobales bacterium]
MTIETTTIKAIPVPTKRFPACAKVAVLIAILIIAVAASQRAHAAGAAVALPNPAVDAPLAAHSGSQTAVFAGGCFWGVQAVFQHVKGVKDATSGYSGGTVASPDYEEVSSGKTGHAESVKITFDPAQVSYGQLLKVFFSVAHDPTELDRQGPDYGTQYRSLIFYANAEQQHIADAYISQLEQARSFPRHIVTQVVPLKAFYPAEPYHQNYAALHPDNPYIAINDAPKVEHLREQFPDLYKR